MQPNDEIIKTLYQNILHQNKFKKIDLYGIFRYLTSKKTKNNFDFSKLSVGELTDEQEKDISEFISKVNPFFKKEDVAKYDYYKNNYILAEVLLKKCIQYERDKNTIAGYKVRFQNSNRYMTYYDFDDDSQIKSNNAAYYENQNEVFARADKYLSFYRFLQIPKSIEIVALNPHDETIESFLIS